MSDFTFKKNPVPTGLASVGHRPGGDIKLKKRVCGFYRCNRNREFVVWFSVVDENERCGWKNICLRHHFPTEEACREWIKKQSKQIQETLHLHFHD